MRFFRNGIRPGTIAFGILILAVLVYAGIESRALIQGPSIRITSPEDGSTVTSPVIVTGVGSHISAISLNDRPILVDQKGNFVEELLLPIGYTILSVKAEDRFGRKTETQLRLFRSS